MDIDVYVGSIYLYPYNFIPKGWAECRGQILQIEQFEALYALIGIKYGGDGRSTFAVPNLQGAEPLPDMKYCIALEGIFPNRS